MLTSICRSIVTICSGLYLCIGMTSFSSKWILSHSTWYKNPRSGHFLCPWLFQLFFLCLESSVGISASEHRKCSGGCGGNFTNDSGGLRGLSFVSLVAEMARSGTQVMLHYPYPLHRRSLRDSSNDKDRLQIERVIRDHQDQWAKEICNAILEHTG